MTAFDPHEFGRRFPRRADAPEPVVHHGPSVRVLDDAPPHDDADDPGHGHPDDRVDGHLDDGVDEDDLSFEPIDLAPVLDGSARQPVPDLLVRDDGVSLFYAGSVNGVHGQSGDGKGWVVCHLVAENARRGRRTMYLDLEDTAASITARLLLLGMSASQILTWLVYVRPQGAFTGAAVERLLMQIEQRNVAAVIIDSLGEAFALEGINEDKDAEVGPWYRRVARRLADAGAAVVIVDHSTKAADNPLHPSGSKRKRAAITGASYLAEAVQPYVKGGGGRLRLTCAKDRHGTHRSRQAAGDLVMTSEPLGGVSLRLYAPSAGASDATVPIKLAARAAVRAAQEAGRPLSQRELVGLMQIKASTDIKRGGIEHAAGEGALVEEAGARGARLFRFDQEMEDE